MSNDSHKNRKPYNPVAENLKCFMKYKGISRKELAESLGVEKNTVDKMLSGSHAISGPYHEILLKEYDCDLNFLYGGVEYSDFLIKDVGMIENEDISKQEAKRRLVVAIEYMVQYLANMPD